MNDYILLTDSSCDLPAEMYAELDLKYVPLTFHHNDEVYKNYHDERDIRIKDFYEQMRHGKVFKTSALNIQDFASAMEPFLTEGKDILYIGFSSGLSSTYNASETAANELKEKYPDRKIYTVDSKSASLGQGLLVYLAAKQRQLGKSIEEVRDYAEEMKLKVCHYFTVDDMKYLKRGGRISGATAAIATVLNIKPVMHVDNNGKLVAIEKARGRKAAVKSLINRAVEGAVQPNEQVFFISHGDCIEEAQQLGETLKEQLKVKQIVYNNIGPVIGSHSGPGTLAMFFIGKQR
ncbi:MAG TPA: DegV family protein [Clostridiales bacterium]|nr:DegV family protein [Clostridiales bacterium]